MTKNAREKRTHPRKPVNILIKYEVVNQFFEDYIKNISLGGIFVETREPLPVHTRLKVRFSLPDMRVPIETTGVVVHSFRPGRVDAPHASGMGIRFSDLTGESRKRLEDYIAGAKTL